MNEEAKLKLLKESMLCSDQHPSKHSAVVNGICTTSHQSWERTWTTCASCSKHIFKFYTMPAVGGLQNIRILCRVQVISKSGRETPLTSKCNA